MEAAQHPLQLERLSALHSYEILDTDREKDFDDIAKLAAALCGTPIALVSLVEAERQWFKAETGLGLRETPIETSICSHAILEAEFIEINDTLTDPRTILNPLCCGNPNLRFYAGALLKTEEGLPIGTLCVLDYEPRALDPVQRDTLRVLAKQVMAQLEMRKALKQAKILRQEVDHRVKNSLQTLASFVRLQARSFGSVEAEQAFNAVLTRIDAVAKLHEQLYRSDTGPRVDLGQYAGYLGEYLAGLAPPNISVHVRSDRVTVDTSQAVAVGTLINEFAANSFKHAFPDERIGMVETQISTLPCGKVSLVCSDNGIGLPEDVATRGGGLGMKIAELVAMELRSNLRIDSGGEGLRFHLEFQPS